MSIRCTIWGHNWTLQTNEDGTGQWQQCARCGKEVVSHGNVGGMGAG